MRLWMGRSRSCLQAILIFATLSNVESQAVLVVDYTYPLTTVADTYLSINIDSGSLYNGFDLGDPVLLQLVANLARAAPLQVRFGGSAANDVTYTGAGGARGNCSANGVTRICVDDTLWADICSFVNRTGSRLVWDLSINPRNPDGSWNSTNSESLIRHTAAQGAAVAAWELGNEEGACSGLVYLYSISTCSRRIAEDMIKHGANFSAAQVGLAQLRVTHHKQHWRNCCRWQGTFTHFKSSYARQSRGQDSRYTGQTPAVMRSSTLQASSSRVRETGAHVRTPRRTPSLHRVC